MRVEELRREGVLAEPMEPRGPDRRTEHRERGLVVQHVLGDQAPRLLDEAHHLVALRDARVLAVEVQQDRRPARRGGAQPGLGGDIRRPAKGIVGLGGVADARAAARVHGHRQDAIEELDLLDEGQP